VQDFLRDQTSGQLAGLIGYLRVDDEVQMQRMTIAFMKAFGGGQGQPPAREEEPVIDTTDPEFAKHFKGFNVEKPKPKRRPQNTQFITG
jgi:hypothetical protein